VLHNLKSAIDIVSNEGIPKGIKVSAAIIGEAIGEMAK
jgi:hypothetical protein